MRQILLTNVKRFVNFRKCHCLAAYNDRFRHRSILLGRLASNDLTDTDCAVYNVCQ